MSEHEIRAILKRVTERLARQVVMPAGRVAIPLALGTGLAGASGCDSETNSTPIYMAPDAFVEIDPGQDPGQDAFNPPDSLYMGPDAYDSYDPGVLPPYMAPDTGYDAGIDAYDPGVLPPYMGPDVGDPGPQPEYMGPDVGEPDPGAPVDAGLTDEGPLPPYMAPDPGNPDPGDMPLYMAP